MWKRILAVLFVVVMVFTAAIPCSAAGSVVGSETDSTSSGYNASAVTTVSKELLKSSAVLDDLAGLSINGKQFDANDYPANSSGSVRLLSLAEFNYADDNADNYLVCIYVYNPAGAKIVKDYSTNRIQLATDFELNGSELKATTFSKFKLEFCNMSADGLFYKYAIKDPNNLLYSAMKNCAELTGGVRRYYVSGIELMISGATNAGDIAVAWHWDYSGYAQTSVNGRSTLTLSEGNEEVLQLELKSTYYRPEGTIEEAGVTYAQLNTVYFSVPQSYLDKYGDMSSVHMEAWIYDTKPIYVLSATSKLAVTAYEHLKQFIGVEVDAPDKNVYYQIYGFNPLTDTTVWNENGDGHHYYYVYNDDSVSGAEVDSTVDTLYWLFETDSNGLLVLTRDELEAYALSYLSKGYTVPYTEEEFEQWKSELRTYCGSLVSSGLISEDSEVYQRLSSYLDSTDYLINGKYPSWLFQNPIDDDVTSGYFEFYALSSDSVDLTSIKCLEKHWVGFASDKYSDLSASYQNIPMIVSLNPNDLTLLSKADFCRAYLIAEEDYDTFKAYAETATANDEVVYLVRHHVTDYTVYAAFTDEYATPTGLKAKEGSSISTQTVFLDLDVIDVTFTCDEVDTVIPCVATPIDVFNSVTRHQNAKVDTNDGIPTWVIIMILVIVCILLVLLFPILQPVFKVVFTLLLIPFRLLWWLLSRIAKGIGAVFRNIGQAISNAHNSRK
jgi:hypothetical protein